MNSSLLKFGLLIVGVVIGGGVTYGVIKATEKSSDTTVTTMTTSMTTMTTTMAPTTTEAPKNSTGTRAYDSLKFVVFVSRHGNRGALSYSADYTRDPYPLSNTTYWPYGVGMLTTYGRLQAYKLGVKLRSLYNGFLPEIWAESDIYPTSDDTNRVILSGMLVLAGLYPPVSYQVWSEDLLWQPIILHTDSPDKSNKAQQCTSYHTDTAIAWDDLKEKDAENITLLQDLIYEATNVTYSPTKMYNLFEKLISEDLEGFRLPLWTRLIYRTNLTDFYGKAFITNSSGSDRVSRLYAGEMLDEVIANMEKVQNGTLTRLMHYYSGHDSTISNMQVMLGVPRTAMVTPIRPGSGLLVELHQDNSTSEYYIQVLFIDGTSADLEPMPLTLSCGDPCYWDSFINSTSNFTGVDFDSVCNETT